ncbi:hypothetical protein EVAR_35918_1 [Eumeta japonica]|uniref:Uncharacterized protein n=1 Tax=Eumeta variegata TaxID=151549 RepID=A0A4C1WT40_EUMVA|nr:hypothetical protein EVAR_35918_1 [Eumeta japonica]
MRLINIIWYVPNLTGVARGRWRGRTAPEGTYLEVTPEFTRSLRLGVTYEKGVTLGNVTMSHRTRERPAECLASLSHSTMIGLPRAQH